MVMLLVLVSSLRLMFLLGRVLFVVLCILKVIIDDLVKFEFLRKICFGIDEMKVMFEVVGVLMGRVNCLVVEVLFMIICSRLDGWMVL